MYFKDYISITTKYMLFLVYSGLRDCRMLPSIETGLVTYWRMSKACIEGSGGRYLECLHDVPCICLICLVTTVRASWRQTRLFLQYLQHTQASM